MEADTRGQTDGHGEPNRRSVTLWTGLKPLIC